MRALTSVVLFSMSVTHSTTQPAPGALVTTRFSCCRRRERRTNSRAARSASSRTATTGTTTAITTLPTSVSELLLPTTLEV